MSFFDELKRRNVFRVGIAYAVAAWLILQFSDIVLNNIEAPEWVFRTILLCMGIGFVLAVVFSWVFEMTPEGLKRESEVDRNQSITSQTGRKLDHLITAVLVIALGYFVVDKFVLSAQREATAVESAMRDAEDTVTDGKVSESATSMPVATTDAPDRSIAVLPFADMSPDKDQEYFSDGLSEELLNLLAKIPELRVAARTSAFSYKGSDAKIDQVGRELGVAHVLEGSVRSAGDRIRVTAQLIKVDDGFHLWSETYDRTVDDVFAIQDEIAGEVVSALKVSLLGDGPHVSETSPEAYALYLQGRHLSNQLTEDGFVNSNELYRQVLELDPAYAPAYAGLARNFRNMMVTGQLDNEEAMRLSIEAAMKAVELDPNLAEAHVRLGMIEMDRENPADAAVHYQRAMELNPGDTSALIGIGQITSLLNDLDTALKLNKELAQLNPVDSLVLQDLGGTYAQMGRLEEAEETFLKMLALNPHVPGGYYRLGTVRFRLGNIDQAEADFEQDEDEEYRVKGQTLIAYARGDLEAFEARFAELRDRWGATWPSEIAHVYAWTGNPDAAFEWLDRAIAVNEGGLNASRAVVWLNPLHDDPRWQDYLEKIGSSDAQLAEIRQKIQLPE